MKSFYQNFYYLFHQLPNKQLLVPIDAMLGAVNYKDMVLALSNLMMQ